MANEICGLAAVGVVNADAVFKAVEAHAPRRHIRHVRLDFKCVERRILRPGGQKQRQHARARAHVCNMLALFYACKIRQQHGVRAEAKTVRALDDAQAVSLQIVDALALAQQLGAYHILLSFHSAS